MRVIVDLFLEWRRGAALVALVIEMFGVILVTVISGVWILIVCIIVF